jgi:hypothetical protein
MGRNSHKSHYPLKYLYADYVLKKHSKLNDRTITHLENGQNLGMTFYQRGYTIL